MAEVYRQQRLEEVRRDALKEDYRVAKCFEGSEGEVGLLILKRLFYDRPSYVQGDPYHTAFREGQRDVVGYIIEAIERVEEGVE